MTTRLQRIAKLEARRDRIELPMPVISRVLAYPGDDIDALVAAELRRLETERGRPFVPGQEPRIIMRTIVDPPLRAE